jgi:hypothetical protein
MNPLLHGKKSRLAEGRCDHSASAVKRDTFIPVITIIAESTLVLIYTEQELYKKSICPRYDVNQFCTYRVNHVVILPCELIQSN